MKASLLPKILVLLSGMAMGLSLGLAPEVLAAPDPNTLLTNPLNRHNLSNWSTHGGVRAALTGGTDQICIFCHTPHGAEAVAAPLWNRTQPAGGPFPLYGGSLAIKDSYGAGIQAAAQYGTGEYPNGASRLCMSCHDGVTAIGIGLLRDGTDIAVVGSAGHEVEADGSLLNTLGTVINLATSHPISFIYDDTIAGQIEAAYDLQFGPGTYFRGPTFFNAAVSSPLDSQNRMQCTTCHDPHYDTSLSNALLPPFWQNPSSALPYDDVCAQCHIGGTPGLPAGDHNPGPQI